MAKYLQATEHFPAIQLCQLRVLIRDAASLSCYENERKLVFLPLQHLVQLRKGVIACSGFCEGKHVACLMLYPEQQQARENKGAGEDQVSAVN